MKYRVALVQMSAGADKAANVAKAGDMIAAAAADGARFVLLPEVFSLVADASLWKDAAEPVPGPTTERLAAAAREHGIFLLGGSILERLPDASRCANTSVLFSPEGVILAVYRKMHLFTVRLPDGVIFDEIDHTAPGNEPAAADTELGRVGLSICYDLRFPELYRALTLMGAQTIAAPSAFTAFTGRSHWELLLRARAVENQVFMLAPNQVGTSVTGVQFYGHSMIVDPWGAVLAEGGEDEQLVSAEIDTDRVVEVRERLGALKHVRNDLLKRLGGGNKEQP